ncbi:hypothetical protein KTH_62310 [Thermosporothrix hazakensis]|nr:hypothetical protein KTH_62310 [Thermosporothrix hazakensis]
MTTFSASFVENEDKRSGGMVLAALKWRARLSDTVLLTLPGKSTDEVSQFAFRLLQILRGRAHETIYPSYT